MESVIYIFMNIVFFTYLIWNGIKYGVQDSVSATYYTLPTNRQFLFTLFCFGYSIPAMYLMTTPLIFLTVLSIGLVGSAASFRGDELIGKLHMIGAFVAVVCSQLSVIIDFKLYIVSVISILLSTGFFLLRNKIKNGVYWAEVVTFLSISYSILTTLK